jgi:hypothetical protein
VRWFGAALGILLLSVGCTSGGYSRTETVPQGMTKPNFPPLTLDCGQEIGVPELKEHDEPPPGYAIIVGVASLATSDSAPGPLQAIAQPDGGFWTKIGLMVRAGEPVELLVPQGMRDRMRIRWGTSGRWTWNLTVPACEGKRPQFVLAGGETKWRVYSGGFWVDDPSCVRLVVRSGEREQEVTIPLGAACPG